MTGFGRAEASDELHRITAEVKTVNNRYLDINVRLPRTFSVFDGEVRALVKKHILRGKTDVFIGMEALGAGDTGVTCNEAVAGEYIRSLKEIAKRFDIPDDVSAMGIARLPDVFTLAERETDEEALRALIVSAVTAALVQCNEARAREGEYLASDIRGKLEKIRADVSFIRERTPEITAQYEEKLKERIVSLIGDTKVDEARLLTEVAIFADKTGVDEELVRLMSHIDAFYAALDAGRADEGIGRKLDFIVQEMNREANTTLSKSPDMEVSQHAVDIKTEIEKIREQIQNLE